MTYLIFLEKDELIEKRIKTSRLPKIQGITL